MKSEHPHYFMLLMVAEGSTDAAIAKELNVSLDVVKGRIKWLRYIYEAKNKAHLVYRAHQFGILGEAHYQPDYRRDMLSLLTHRPRRTIDLNRIRGTKKARSYDLAETEEL
jgi:DNA-binding CsgD family transcriptional regulator